MKDFIKKYQKAIVGTGAISVLLICYFQQKQLVELRKEVKELNYLNGGDIVKSQYIDSLKTVNDSLSNDNFVKSTIIGRYEIALELFKESNKKGADEFELIMSTQTE